MLSALQDEMHIFSNLENSFAGSTVYALSLVSLAPSGYIEIVKGARPNQLIVTNQLEILSNLLCKTEIPGFVVVCVWK